MRISDWSSDVCSSDLTPATKLMFGAAQIARMRPGTHLINASRGSVVDIDALAGALRSGHLAGAAVDVFPSEPKGNEDPFESPLLGLANVILTTHGGGSTLERSEERRVGKECFSSCRYRWSPYQ